MKNKIAKGTIAVAISAGAIIGVSLSPVGTYENFQEIQIAEEIHFAKTGEYVQILLNGTTPDGRKVEEVLGKKVSKGTQVYIFETPKGEKGYEIFYKEPNATSTPK